MTKKCLVCLALCFIGGTTGAWAVSTRTGDVIHCRSEKHKFYMTVPGRWRKVTQDQMDAFRASVDPGDDEFSLEGVAAYGRDYVMGQPTSVIAVAVGYYNDNRQITNREIRQTVKLLTGADLDKIRRASRSRGRDYSPPNVRNMTTREVSYSEEKKRLIWDVELEAMQGVTVRMHAYVYFGRKAVVMVFGAAPSGQFDNCDLALTGADQTFSFEPGAEFQQTEWYRSYWFAIVLIVVATSLLAFTFRERKH